MTPDHKALAIIFGFLSIVAIGAGIGMHFEKQAKFQLIAACISAMKENPNLKCMELVEKVK